VVIVTFVATMSIQDYTYYKEVSALITEGQFDKAISLLNEALTIHPNHPDVFHDRGVCRFRIDDKNKALDDMNRAVELQPEYSYRYASRAFIRSALKDVSGAIEDYKKAIDLDPEDAISYNNLGLLEEQVGYTNEARERFKVADELMNILNERDIDFDDPVSQPESDQPEEQEPKRSFKAHVSEISRVFKNKKSLLEFVSFVRNGFKLKK
jgi:tetratricopeptide (TPR) repeat protein